MDARELDLTAMRRLVKELFPELLGYHLPAKARVVKVHEDAGKIEDSQRRYSVDVQLLKPDGSDDEQAPVIPDVEIPTWWAGPDRGIFCLPVVGAIVRVAWDYGDPACPYIASMLGYGFDVPAHLLGALVIQHSKDCFVTIDPETNIIVQHDPETKVVIDKERNIAVLTPENETHEVKKTFAVKCQQALVECEKVAQVKAETAVVDVAQTATVKAGVQCDIDAPKVVLAKGGHPAGRGDLTQDQFNAHVHISPHGPTSPPVSPMVGVPSDPVEVP